jgi:hypothetical protein
MSHNNHTLDGINKDLILNNYTHSQEYYLNLIKNWKDPYEKPVVKTHEGIRVVREDLITGTKVRGASALISNIKNDTLVYVQPRVGLAGVSLLDVAEKYNKKVVLFMPSSKKISDHQACCIERGAQPIFHRIAAMPNLNRIAEQWAKDNNAYFIPLGLKHEYVTAGVIKTALQIEAPKKCYIAISTGVLSRALQIAWPKTEFISVAVSRNLKDGELGRSDVISDPLVFQKVEKDDNLPPFPTVPTYDGKVWKYIPKNTNEDILFWNVGAEPELINKKLYESIDSYRSWNEAY